MEHAFHLCTFFLLLNADVHRAFTTGFQFVSLVGRKNGEGKRRKRDTQTMKPEAYHFILFSVKINTEYKIIIST